MKPFKTLILLDSSYPFDSWGIFIENEIKYLSAAFDKVYVFSTSESTAYIYTPLQNMIVFRKPISLNLLQKILCFKFVFSSYFFNELCFIRRTLRLPVSFYKLRIFLTEIYKANILYNFIRHQLNDELRKKNNQLFIYSYWNNYLAITATLLKKTHKLPKAFSRAHGWDVYFERHPENYLPGKSILYRGLDAIYFISKHGFQYSKNKIGNFPNLEISKLGINNNIAPDFGKKNIPFHLVSCSSIISLKRIDLIIEAISLVSEEYSIRWTHIGSGILAEKIKVLAEEKLATKYNITYNFQGYLENDQVINFHRTENVHILINVSISEGIPVTIMEAMSCGIPCIATNVGGTSEILEDGKNGILLNADPLPHEIADVLKEYLIMDEDIYIEQCKAAYTTWKEKYNAEINYKDFVKKISCL